MLRFFAVFLYFLVFIFYIDVNNNNLSLISFTTKGVSV